jgi:hypothetical protein
MFGAPGDHHLQNGSQYGILSIITWISCCMCADSEHMQHQSASSTMPHEPAAKPPYFQRNWCNALWFKHMTYPMNATPVLKKYSFQPSEALKHCAAFHLRRVHLMTLVMG